MASNSEPPDEPAIAQYVSDAEWAWLDELGAPGARKVRLEGDAVTGTNGGQSLRIVVAIGAAKPYVANVPGCCAPADEPDGAWSKKALELHWPLGDGRLGVLCGSADFVSVTFHREVFDAHEFENMACRLCAVFLHAVDG
jgi:hypothetical protein